MERGKTYGRVEDSQTISNAKKQKSSDIPLQKTLSFFCLMIIATTKNVRECILINNLDTTWRQYTHSVNPLNIFKA